MMKKIIYLLILISINTLFSQELFIQNSDKIKGSKRVMGKEYTTVYDNTNHRYRYFEESGKEIFLIKSFNEENEEELKKTRSLNQLKLLLIIIL